MVYPGRGFAPAQEPRRIPRRPPLSFFARFFRGSSKTLHPDLLPALHPCFLTLSVQTAAMKKLSLVLLASLLGLCGCAHQYVMKLSNGGQITTPGKPKLKGSSYEFKDAKGEVHYISAGRVTEVEPASMAQEEEQALKPKMPRGPRHWYYFWLN